MRRDSRLPAERLGSVAGRYRHALGALSDRGGPAIGLGPGGTKEAPADEARGPLARDGRLAKLEAVLLVAGDPLASRKLAELANLADGKEVRKLVRQLNKMYDAAGSAFRVEEIAGGYQLLTREAFGPWLRRLHQQAPPTRLSGPAIETLAVVAYRQPVLRAEIEAIRGVQCGEVLRQLMERDLVRIAGRSEELGRPFLYGTTRRFLQVYGLRSLEELPRADVLRTAGGEDGGAEAGGQAEAMEEARTETDESREEPQVTTELSEQAAEEITQQRPTDQPRGQDVDEEYDFDDDDDEEDEDEDWDDDFDDEDFEDEEDEDEDEFEDQEWEEVEDDEDEEDDDEDWDEEEEDWDDEDEDEDEDWEEEDEEDEEEETP